jgi:hypothetical protein
MLTHLLSNGCSFLTKRRGMDNHTGVLLSGHYGYEHIGLASSGKGNDRLIVTTKLFFYENPERIKDTFVLIGWTNPARSDYIDNYREDWSNSGTWGESWFSLKTKKEKEKPPRDPSWSTYKQIHNYGNLIAKMFRQILEMQDFFENLGIKYCMYHSLNVLPANIKVKLEKLELLRERINNNRFYRLGEKSHASFICADKSKFTVSRTDLHPSDEGHLAWQKKIKAFIEENSLI